MKFVIVALLIFGLGGCLGAKTGSSREVEFVKIRQPQATVTVTATPEPADPYMPEACENALAYAARASRSAERIYNKGDRQLDIISDARRLFAQGLDLDPAENEQRDLQGATIGELATLAENLHLYDTAVQECEDAQ